MPTEVGLAHIEETDLGYQQHLDFQVIDYCSSHVGSLRVSQAYKPYRTGTRCTYVACAEELATASTAAANWPQNRVYAASRSMPLYSYLYSLPRGSGSNSRCTEESCAEGAYSSLESMNNGKTETWRRVRRVAEL